MRAVFPFIFVVLSVYLVSARDITAWSFLFPNTRPEMYLGVNLVENYLLPSTFDKTRAIPQQVQFFFPYGDNLDYRKSVLRISNLNANTIAINPMAWMENLNSTEIQIDRTSRRELIAAIRFAKMRGLKVFLRPQIHLTNENSWIYRGSISPQKAGNPDWGAWFQSFQKMTEYFLDIALEAEADCYVFGIELNSTLEHIQKWSPILHQMKSQVSRSRQRIRLSYDALAFQEVFTILERVASGNPLWNQFFDTVDHLGLNLYENFSSTGVGDANLEDLQRNMESFALKLKASLDAANGTYLSHFPHRQPKKILIAEYGIKSTKGALYNPFIHPGPDDELDFEPQVLGYQAALSYFSKLSWIEGFLAWNMHVDPYYGIPGLVNRDTIDNGIKNFSITGKPAESEIRKIFDHILSGGQRELMRPIPQVAFLVSALILGIFAIKRIFLLKTARLSPPISKWTTPQDDKWPLVTVQLPIYNEQFVVERLIKAVFKLNYPPSQLEIQILDDSDDVTTKIIANALAEAPPNLVIKHIHRTHRDGFKAGALAAGLGHSSGQFIAIFDADFIPPPDFLKETVPEFNNPEVGLVQGRWSFINSRILLLERVQAVFLDAHFLIEHQARFASGLFFNFNGTAGIFRKSCIDSAGGWHTTSLTEDLDLSYRAQLKGWKFIFRKDLICPSELPKALFALRRQQFRWSKGSAQVLRLMLPTILSSKFSIKIKAEAVYHLINNCGSPIILSSVVSFLLFSNNPDGLSATYNVVAIGVLSLASCLNILFYIYSSRRAETPWFQAVPEIAAGMGLIVGLSINNSIAVLEGLFKIASPFERTPKWGGERTQLLRNALVNFESSRMFLVDGFIVMAELATFVLCLQTAEVHLLSHNFMALVFSTLFSAGFGVVLFAGLNDLTLKTLKIISKRLKYKQLPIDVTLP